MDPIETALLRDVSDEARVRGYYAPVARFVRDVVSAAARLPAIVGVSGPQGSGKSTLADAVVRALAELGIRGIAISIDDFYLTHAEQRALAARHPGNRCLEHRGYPGTHDVELGRSVLESLAAGAPTRVPAYDKGAHGGRGDRTDPSAFRTVDRRLDLVILEGWMLGFAPVEPAVVPPLLAVPNEMLAAYARWHETLDALVHLRAASLDDVVRWRIDAERARREAGLGGLTDEEARDYIERFVPAYEVWVPGLCASPPCARALRVELGPDRGALRIA